MSWLRVFLLSVCAFGFARAGEPQPATTAAFDRYAALVEQQLKTKVGLHHFLWIDEHPQEKSLAFFSQDVIVPLKMLDNGQEIEVPDGLLQHWLGAIFLDNTTFERVRNTIFGFADYKDVFKDQIVDSKLIKRDGDHFDASMRIYKSQLRSVALDVKLSADYAQIDPTRAYMICRSTHIGEAIHPNKKTSTDERSPEDEYGYLWRLNMYWRLERVNNGVYVEVESLSLSRDAKSNVVGRLLNGFVQDFPRAFVAGLMDGLRKAYPLTH